MKPRKELNTSQIKRLSFIRFLYLRALQQSEEAEPLNASSILTFQDSIELFFQLAFEFLDISTKKEMPFMQYWEVIQPKIINDELGGREEIKRLNNARVALKHHGIFPSKIDIEGFRIISTIFFETNTPIIFGVSFSEIYLSDFIDSEDVRVDLRIGEIALGNNEYDKALDHIALSFQKTLDNFLKSKQRSYPFSPYDLGCNYSVFSDHYLKQGYSNQNSLFASKEFKAAFNDFVDYVEKGMEQTQKILRIITLGIDYPKYAKFAMLTPQITGWEGDYKINRDTDLHIPVLKASKGDVTFCLEFVIESALNLQEKNYEFKIN